MIAIENDAPGGVTCLAKSLDNQQLIVAYSHADGAYMRIYQYKEAEHIGAPGEVLLNILEYKLLLTLQVNIPQADQQQISTTISAVTFNQDAQLIACVTSAPDFNLFIFNSVNGQLVLKSKGFTSDIYSIQFNKYNSAALTTGGKNHIKFWQMA